jgi:hypothetical protein
LLFFVLENAIVEIAAICKLHDDAERARLLVEKGLLVCNDVFVLDARENPHLVERIGLLLLGKLVYPYLFKCVFLEV